jgi:hypothetical protein
MKDPFGQRREQSRASNRARLPRKAGKVRHDSSESHERPSPFPRGENHKLTLGRSPDLQAKPLMRLETLRLPRFTRVADGRSILLLTVAGPRRTCTGFPVMPSRAPKMLELDNSTDRPQKCHQPAPGRLHAGFRSVQSRRFVARRRIFSGRQRSPGAAGTTCIPDSAIQPAIGQRPWRDIRAPECRQGQLESIHHGSTDHRRMCPGKGVRSIALFLPPGSRPILAVLPGNCRRCAVPFAA